MTNEFPLGQWFDLTKLIDKSDMELVAAQMCLYEMKDGGSGKSRELRQACESLRIAVKQHNKFLKQKSTDE